MSEDLIGRRVEWYWETSKKYEETNPDRHGFGTLSSYYGDSTGYVIRCDNGARWYVDGYRPAEEPKYASKFKVGDRVKAKEDAEYRYCNPGEVKSGVVNYITSDLFVLKSSDGTLFASQLTSDYELMESNLSTNLISTSHAFVSDGSGCCAGAGIDSLEDDYLKPDVKCTRWSKGTHKGRWTT